MTTNYEISLAPGSAYIVCKVVRPVTLQSMREQMRDLRAFAFEYNVNSYLIDKRAVRNLELPSAIHRMIKEDKWKRATNPPARVAELVSPGDRSHDALHDAGRAVGYDIRAFGDEAEAIAWLAARPEA